MCNKYSISNHSGFNATFRTSRLTLGLFLPIEAYAGDTPTMKNQEQLAIQAEGLGFSTLWFRDVPLRVPAFGDVGQIYDPFVYLGWIGAKTHSIALATGALVLPLRHPLHTAKAAASIDKLTGGRFIFGVSSGDRPEEYPAFGVNMETRSDSFRENLKWIRSAWNEKYPQLESPEYGILTGAADPIPKPTTGTIPTMIVGGSQQSIHWTAKHADAWVMYPRPLNIQSQIIAAWRDAVSELYPGKSKPFAQSLYIDIVDEPDAAPKAIHLGFKSGRNHLINHLRQLEELGVNHVILNLKYSSRPAGEVIQEIGEFVIPLFINREDPDKSQEGLSNVE